MNSLEDYRELVDALLFLALIPITLIIVPVAYVGDDIIAIRISVVLMGLWLRLAFLYRVPLFECVRDGCREIAGWCLTHRPLIIALAEIGVFIFVVGAATTVFIQ